MYHLELFLNSELEKEVFQRQLKLRMAVTESKNAHSSDKRSSLSPMFPFSGFSLHLTLQSFEFFMSFLQIFARLQLLVNN